MLTAQRLDEMQRVNIGAVAADTLADVSGLRLGSTLSRKERLARFFYETKLSTETFLFFTDMI